jgi:protein phosphatase 1 regulatory subunit 11
MRTAGNRQNQGSVTETVGSATRSITTQTPITLRLRAEPSEQRHIQWAEDVVDNEGMGKKSSKGSHNPT